MNFITETIAKGIEPSKNPNDTIVLKDGRKYRKLVGVDGKLTKAGRFYENWTGKELPRESYDTEQTPIRVGNVETIKLRGGKEKVVRRFDPATGDYKYTQLGKHYYGSKQVQYVVRVPSTFSGTRSNGEPYTRNGFFPVDNPISLPQNLTLAQRDSRIKQYVESVGAILDCQRERNHF